MNRQNQSPPYGKRNLSFLVRIWQEGVHAPWRASVQAVRTGETIRFATLAELYTFLGSQTITARETEEKSTGNPFTTSQPKGNDAESAM